MNTQQKIECSFCGEPVVFNDISRTDKQTLGIYICPKCHRRYKI